MEIEIKKLFKKRTANAKPVQVPASKLAPVSRRATTECPHPGRWSAFDSANLEIEVLDFLRTVVMTIKPELIVETGARNAVSTIWLAEGLKVNGFGTVISCEPDKLSWQEARNRIDASAVAEWIQLFNQSGVELEIKGEIDLLFLNSDASLREAEVRRFLPQVNPYGLILMTDASSDLKIVREIALKLEKQGLISSVLLATPGGMVMAQKREGRT